MRVFREPCYFAEAVYLLYHHVNQISYEEEYKRVIYSFGYPFLDQEQDERYRRICELIRVAQEVTHELNLESERFRYYFEVFPAADGRRTCCLAQTMLMAIHLDCSHVDDFAHQLICSYHEMQQLGMKINDINSTGLVVEQRDAQETPESLAAQLERLPCDLESKWKLLRMLTDFECHVRELTELIRPVAEKLCHLMHPLVEMNEGILAEWSVYFSDHTMDDFQRDMFNSSFLFSEANTDHEIWLCLWNFNFWGTWSEWISGAGAQGKPVRVAYIGMGISFDFAAHRRRCPDTETLCTMLKALGGKDKLDTLRLCAMQPFSAARLVETMHLNSGTVSRNLYSLYKLGFLETQGDGERVNYSTRMDSLHQLFGWITEYLENHE